MKRIFVLSILSLFVLGVSYVESEAQIRYRSNGKITFGDTEPMTFYDWTAKVNGIFLKINNSNFLQLDLSPANPRIAGHGNQVVFYNTQSGTFNSIQVAKVFNYSDARAKSNVRSLSSGMDIISKLRPVSYDFTNTSYLRRATFNKYTGSNTEIGLLAQDVEAVLPNLVYTDEEGHKLIDYTALIPVLIDAVKTLQKEVDVLKSQVKNK